MAQKNELMDVYIKNGMTSLDDMRNHFNYFSTGGVMDGPGEDETEDSNEKPASVKTVNGLTLEQFLAKKAAEEQEKYYLQGSRNRTTPHYIYGEGLTDEYKELLHQRIKDENEFINSSIQTIAEFLGKKPEVLREHLDKDEYPVIHFDPNIKYNNGKKKYLYRHTKTLLNLIGSSKETIQRAKTELGKGQESLLNCIATATSNNPNPGHYVTGNQEFRSNPGKYGWKETTIENINPGGLVQIRGVDGTPHHAVILDSKNGGDYRVNYSDGGNNYKKNKPLWNIDNNYFYNFVGNAADSLRWTNEFNSLYDANNGKSYGIGGLVNNNQRMAFKQWVEKMHEKHPWLEINSDRAGYDYETYFNENYEDAIRRLYEDFGRHFPSKYKMYNHPTFSNESIYSYGPAIGGSWDYGKPYKEGRETVIERIRRIAKGEMDDKFIPSPVNKSEYSYIYKQDRPYTEDEIYEKLEEQNKWMNRAKDLERAYEKFLSKVTPTYNTANDETTDVLGYGMSYYINDDGSTRDFNPNETITKDEAEEQLDRWYKYMLPKYVGSGKGNLNAKNWDYYDPRVKMAIADAVFNGGVGMVNDRSPNFMGELRKYDNSFVNGESDYDIRNLLQHADWNKSTKVNDESTDLSWIALRSRARQYPDLFDWDSLGDTYKLPISKLQEIIKDFDTRTEYKYGGHMFEPGGNLDLNPFKVSDDPFGSSIKDIVSEAYRNYAKENPIYTGKPLQPVEITAERLPNAGVTDDNVRKYTDAVNNGLLNLTQIPNTNLQRAVKVRQFQDDWRDTMGEVSPKVIGALAASTLLPITLAETAPLAIQGFKYAWKPIAKVLSNPYVDAGLTLHGAITAPGNIKEGIGDIRDKRYGRGAFNLGLTALDLYGAGKLAKHGYDATKRLAEVFVRQGDALHGMNINKAKKLLTNKNTLNYIFNGWKHPELAYLTGDYSGNVVTFYNNPVSDLNSVPHKGDVVDAFFGKPRNKNEYVKELKFDDLSKEMQEYINKKYKHKKNKIKIFDLGDDIESPHSLFDSTYSEGLSKRMNNQGHFYLLDPGGFHEVRKYGNHLRNEDIWKYNWMDYFYNNRGMVSDITLTPDESLEIAKKLNLSSFLKWGKLSPMKKNMLLKKYGLKFIDNMGTPVVHVWRPKQLAKRTHNITGITDVPNVDILYDKLYDEEINELIKKIITGGLELKK